MIKDFFARYFHYFFILLLELFLFLCYKLRLFHDLGVAIKESKIFFSILLSLAAVVALCCFPARPLVYFDEHNYLIQAQNIFEHNINSLCNVNVGGECESFGIAPHGMGLSAIYALFYDHDFNIFYWKLIAFNLFLYLLNPLLIFLISARMFADSNIAKVASVLVLAAPYNLIYATNVMPATLMSTLFLMSLFAYTICMEDHEETRTLAFWAVLCALMLMSSIRIEYVVILTTWLLSDITRKAFQYLRGDMDLGKTTVPTGVMMLWIMKGIGIGAAVSLVYAHAFLYTTLKYSSTEARIGLSFFNLSYLKYFFSDFGFWLLNIGVVGYVIFSVMKKQKPASAAMMRAAMTVLGLFVVFLILYSFFSFKYVYRVVIPITSIYLIFVSLGLGRINGLLQKYIPFFPLIIVIIVGLSFILHAFKDKQMIIRQNIANADFLHMLDSGIIAKISSLYPGENYHFFRAPYLGQIDRIDNYLDDDRLASQKLNAGYNLFYLETPFEKIDRSPFADEQEYSRTLLFKDLRYRFNVYKISLLKAEDE